MAKSLKTRGNSRFGSSALASEWYTEWPRKVNIFSVQSLTSLRLAAIQLIVVAVLSHSANAAVSLQPQWGETDSPACRTNSTQGSLADVFSKFKKFNICKIKLLKWLTPTPQLLSWWHFWCIVKDALHVYHEIVGHFKNASPFITVMFLLKASGGCNEVTKSVWVEKMWQGDKTVSKEKGCVNN